MWPYNLQDMVLATEQDCRHINYLIRQQLTNSLASAENLSGNCGTGLSEPIANMAAIGFISALK